MKEKAQQINKKLQRGDRKFIAQQLGITYQTVYMSLKNPTGSDTELAVLKFATHLIDKREKKAQRIAKLIEEKGWATDCGGIGNVN